MADGYEEARRQYRVGGFNRRVALETENLAVLGMAADNRTAQLLCTCGRADCREILAVTIDEFEQVRSVPHRFLVAPGHETEVDQLVVSTERYAVVSVKPEFRLQQ